MKFTLPGDWRLLILMFLFCFGSLLGVSLKGLCAVCLLGFLLNADPRWWSSNVKCKVQTIASFSSLSYKSNSLLSSFLSQITIAESVGQGL